MKKINIVKSNEEFNNIIKEGKVYKNSYFVVYTQKNSIEKYRFGISVGKKVTNAVGRNKLKRKVKNILDNHKNIYSNSRDYIIIIRSNALDIDYSKMENCLVELLNKIEKDDRNEK